MKQVIHREMSKSNHLYKNDLGLTNAPEMYIQVYNWTYVELNVAARANPS